MLSVDHGLMGTAVAACLLSAGRWWQLACRACYGAGQWRERLHGVCRGYGLCGAEGCCACVVLVHGLRHAAIAVGLFGNVLVEAAGAIAVGINGHVGEP